MNGTNGWDEHRLLIMEFMVEQKVFNKEIMNRLSKLERNVYVIVVVGTALLNLGIKFLGENIHFGLVQVINFFF